MDIAPIKPPYPQSKVTLADLNQFLQMVAPEDILACLHTRMGPEANPLIDSITATIAKCQEHGEFNDIMEALVSQVMRHLMQKGPHQAIVSTFMSGLVLGVHICLTTTNTTTTNGTIN